MLEQIADKMRALKGVVVAVEKQFGKGAIMTLGDDEEAEPVATIPTGSLALDLATGIGGYPRGRVVEIYGPESSGKTTLALHAIAEAQRGGGVAAFIDAEHALDVAYARGIGVETEKLLISQPDTGEQALDITEMLVRCGAVDLVVIDSVAALTPKAELEGEMGDAHMGLQARLMSQALRKLTAVAYRGGHDAHLPEPAPPEDRRHLRLARDDDRRQRAEVLRVDALRRAAHRAGEGRRRAGRRAHARQDREEQVRAALHARRSSRSAGASGVDTRDRAARPRHRARARRQGGQPPVVRGHAARQRARALARHARRRAPSCRARCGRRSSRRARCGRGGASKPRRRAGRRTRP